MTPDIAQQDVKPLLFTGFVKHSPSIFAAKAVWNRESNLAGVGFHISNYNATSCLVLAGCGPSFAETGIEADAQALILALQSSLNLSVICKHIFLANAALLKAITLGCRQTLWRLDPLFNSISYLLNELNSPQISHHTSIMDECSCQLGHSWF
ncbi:uncharacterized protein LOC120264582 isoform X2 [Dioscorea cayenensis subsp. rotundata]|uniref:Uncharacterized protein LOC120264582 isoform X2 n=1 Tax=Dioscorea cayennensis subsp. rotundata TaxID=55577 RepID=A0AB40BPE5_DIOCR|nr:uncharacterized protein LOC120264582 isoform X2 [Dioscorea cayenensis subsp. rotundata]